MPVKIQSLFMLLRWSFLAFPLLASTFVEAADEKSAEQKTAAPPSKQKVDFVRDIKPILVKSCYECHGPEMQEAGFRVDRKVDALAGGDSGESIVPGASETSLLVEYISGENPDLVMPPEGDLLSETDVDLIRAWIDQGATWPQSADTPEKKGPVHWSYRPLMRPDAPKLSGKNHDWVRNPIDAFVLSRLQKANVAPSPEADRYTLARRLYLDLWGLLPSPEDVDLFVKDTSPNAYEKLVDHLLESEHFGERWGRHWLDKARYADSDGYEKDRARPNAWKYRDWVIRVINDDLPFDQFTVEQLAGDLLPNSDWNQKLATAFHRQTLTNTEGGTDQEQFRVEAVFDRVETTGAIWLGLTLTCARCHSHKYDDVPQREYYQLYAFFNNGDETNTSVPISESALAGYNVKKAEHDKAVQALQQKITQARSKLEPALAKWEQARKTPSVVWTMVEPASVTSAQGATFTKQKDGSYLASGKNPEKDTYTIQFRTALSGITGFRLETLPDKKLPANGPGRVKHGNFVLNDFKVSVRSGAEKASKPVTLSQGTSDFTQKDFSAARAIDNDPKTGWAIGPQFGKRHVAVFEAKQPLAVSAGETQITITLNQNHGQQHTIGRFRLSVTTSQQPVVYDVIPDNVAQVLAVVTDKRTGKQKKALLDYYAGIDPGVSKLNTDLDALKKKAPKSAYMNVRIVTQRTKDPRQTHFLLRGDFLQPQKAVQPGTLGVLNPFQPQTVDGNPNRLDFARWLMSVENPLTPRVVVNQMWSYLFGRGLVRTLSDFGVRGERPTHPALLDWLATEYRRLGWRRKAMLKTIVMSSTYRQSSVHRPELIETDAGNQLLHRQNRFRAEAETVRDMSLTASGLLSRKIGGPSVFPPMPKDVAELSYAGNFRWATSKGADRFRRGMYTFFKRTAPHPNLTAFDCPDSNLSCLQRTSSNTPLQALITLNNEVFVESSQALTRRVLSGSAKGDADRVTHAFRICLARPPSKMEHSRLLELLADGRDWYKTHPEDAKKLIGSYLPEKTESAEAAAWVALSRVILNFDEFITRE